MCVGRVVLDGPGAKIARGRGTRVPARGEASRRVVAGGGARAGKEVWRAAGGAVCACIVHLTVYSMVCVIGGVEALPLVVRGGESVGLCERESGIRYMIQT